NTYFTISLHYAFQIYNAFIWKQILRNEIYGTHFEQDRMELHNSSNLHICLEIINKSHQPNEIYPPIYKKLLRTNNKETGYFFKRSEEHTSELQSPDHL